MVDSAKNNVSKYIIFLAGFADQGVLKKDPTVRLERARPTPKYISMYFLMLNLIIIINDVQFGNKSIQWRKLPNSFLWIITLLWKVL
jgi:hypothetical protein